MCAKFDSAAKWDAELERRGAASRGQAMTLGGDGSHAFIRLVSRLVL